MRAIEPADLPGLLALNNAHSIEVGAVDEAKLRAFLSASVLSIAAGPPGHPEAFLIAFDHGTPAQGPNHAWFLARLPQFFYVDRVCVDARSRRKGLARALYAEAFATAARRAIPTVCCEVNIDPPNPASDAFHTALGFFEVGRAFLPERGKTVRYLEHRVG
jgi:predicted GNAT superfamily acetyltransferase